MNENNQFSLEDVYLKKDFSNSKHFLDKILVDKNNFDFHWMRIPVEQAIQYADFNDIVEKIINRKTIGDSYNKLPTDIKVLIYCHLYYWLETRPEQNLLNLIALYYDFEYYEDEDEEIIKCIYPKTNTEILQECAKIDELKDVMRYLTQLDYQTALSKLSMLFEPIRNDYKNLLPEIEDFFKFVNEHKGIRHNKKNTGIPANDLQLKIYCDFGLSLYRLFYEYNKNNNDK